MHVDDCYQLGYIVKPHGLKGEVQIFIDSDDPQAYQNLELVFVQQGQQLVPFFIESISKLLSLKFIKITGSEKKDTKI